MTLKKSKAWQQHQNYDQLQDQQKHFVCCTKGSTHKTCLEQYDVESDSIVFDDAKVLLAQSGPKQTQKTLRLVGYLVDGVKYWVATDRFDLTAEEISFIYKLRWEIENSLAGGNITSEFIISLRAANMA